MCGARRRSVLIVDFAESGRHCRRLLFANTQGGAQDKARCHQQLGADMIRTLFVAALLAGFMTGPALAQTKVGDWTIEKREKDSHCNAARGYKDKDDENRGYVMVLSYAADKIVIVMIYDGWEWEKPGEIQRADFSTDKTDIKKGA